MNTSEVDRVFPAGTKIGTLDPIAELRPSHTVATAKRTRDSASSANQDGGSGNHYSGHQNASQGTRNKRDTSKESDAADEERIRREDVDMSHLTEEEADKLWALLSKYKACFAKTVDQLGNYQGEAMRMNTS